MMCLQREREKYNVSYYTVATIVLAEVTRNFSTRGTNSLHGSGYEQHHVALTECINYKEKATTTVTEVYITYLSQDLVEQTDEDTEQNIKFPTIANYSVLNY